METQKDELDRWLDDALADYRAPEPRQGLELRALAYVRSETQVRVGHWWRWTLAGTVGVLAIIAAVFVLRNQPAGPPQAVHQGPPAVPRAAGGAALASAQVPHALQHRKRLVSRHVMEQSRAVAMPRLAVFPAPQPLTAEERAFMTLARRAPDVVAQLGHDEGPLKPPPPITIEKITITPLDEKVSGGEK